MLTSAKLKGPWFKKSFFIQLHMRVYLRTKFQISSIILTGVRQGGARGTTKQTPKKPTLIRVNNFLKITVGRKSVYIPHSQIHFV